MPKDNVKSFIRSHNVINQVDDYWTEDGFSRLKPYLGAIQKGQSKIYTAPFAKGDSMRKVLQDWEAVLESLSDTWPTLVSFEKDLANKVGPMSVELPVCERIKDISHYYEDILLSSKPVDQRAVDAVVREFSRVRGLRVRGQKFTLANMKKSTSSGNPWQTKKRNVLQDIIPCEVLAIPRSRRSSVIGMIQKNPWSFTAVLGWRGQEGGPTKDDVKQRVVWMFPFAVNLCELQVYQPLIEACQSYNLVPAWVSMESVDREITELFDSKPSNDLVICTDFSKFDQHFNRDLQGSAKSILTALLSDEQPSRHWLNRVFPIKYNIPLVWDYDGPGRTVSMFTGPHGMGSGSGGTNADETLAHRSLQHEAAILHGQKLNPHSMCLGDDGILTYPGITVDDVVKVYQSHGQECNVSKQYASTQDCVYLRRWHHKDYRIDGVCAGVYSTCRALGRLRYLERFMDPEYWSPELVALRQLSIIENCKFHPLFEEFVQFCMKRDKYRLGLDIPGFMDNLTQLAIESTDHIKDFLGYTKTLQGEGPEGIASWRVVQYLKSQR